MPFPKPHPRRKHKWDARKAPPAAAAPPGPAVVCVVVEKGGGGLFLWLFDRPFDDAHVGDWTPADFAGLTVAGAAPVALDEVVGADGNLTLLYDVAFAEAFDVTATPAVLRFDGGPAAIEPTSGPIA